MTRLKLCSNQLIFFIAVYITFVANSVFLLDCVEIISKQSVANLPFLISIPLLLLSLTFLVLRLITPLRVVVKPVLILITVISALIAAGQSRYGIVFDYGMVENIFETDVDEATTYLSFGNLGLFLGFVSVPLGLISVTKIKADRVPVALKRSFIMSIIALVLIGLIAALFYADYAATGRNNRFVKKELVPFQFVSSAIKFVNNRYLAEPVEFEILDAQPTLIAAANKKPRLNIMVVGETARAQNFQYQGYERPTNQFTKDYSPVYFNNVVSCGTATAVSVPCMFSFQVRENFDRNKSQNQQNVLDIAEKAGIGVTWVDNNSGCKEVCNRVETIKVSTDEIHPMCDGDYCYDAVLIEQLHTLLNGSGAQGDSLNDRMVVLHMIGSHGPTYYRRYPATSKYFTPDCPTNEIQSCSQDELVNTYDNTILYSDYVNASIIRVLQEYQNNFDVSMLYISDHGESLGENGAYLHGFPYMFAPDTQTHVPMLFWSSDHKQMECASRKSQESLSHDFISHTLLGLMGINSTLYNADLDLLQC